MSPLLLNILLYKNKTRWIKITSNTYLFYLASSVVGCLCFGFFLSTRYPCCVLPLGLSGGSLPSTPRRWKGSKGEKLGIAPLSSSGRGHQCQQLSAERGWQSSWAQTLLLPESCLPNFFHLFLFYFSPLPTLLTLPSLRTSSSMALITFLSGWFWVSIFKQDLAGLQTDA